MFSKIKTKAEELEPLLIKIRRYLHQNPELSGKEYHTTEYIFNQLKEAGIESKILETEAGPAVVANIRTNENKETIAFRADIDALPVLDKKNKPYSSENAGIMHACGHDFNIVSILGTALLLASIKQDLDVNIKFIFQPSEETPEGGAEALINTGAMDNVKAIWTVHALPSLPVGKIGIKYGPMTASIDSFKITVNGVGGHSARPHQAVDSIFVANQILNCLYSNITRNFDPINPITISIGSIHSGTAPNIISDTCTIEGTVRTFDNDIRNRIPELINNKVDAIAKTFDATSEIEWHYGPSGVVNDQILAKLTEETAATAFGHENIVSIAKPSMGAEDFSRYLKYSPGMLIRIGTGSENCSYPLHSCLFDVDENAIITAVKLLSLVTVNFQNNKSEARCYINSLTK